MARRLHTTSPHPSPNALGEGADSKRRAITATFANPQTLCGIIKTDNQIGNDMKNLVIGLFLTLIACGQNTNQHKQDEKVASNIDKYIGIYEYVYPDNTQDLTENHFIVLSKNGDKITGFYYGTSDEFDEAREGYLPGFFVSPMDNLQINGDTIRFVLNTNNSDFLTKSVDLKIQSTKEAINAGYKNWENKILTAPKTYIGLIKDSKTIFFKGKMEFLDKTFKKKK